MRLIDEQYMRHPDYGSPRMTDWLQEQGYAVNHKRVAVSYTHLRAHETPEQLVCRLLLEKKKTNSHNQVIPNQQPYKLLLQLL